MPVPNNALEHFKNLLNNLLEDSKSYLKTTVTPYLELTKTLSRDGVILNEIQYVWEDIPITKEFPLSETITQEDVEHFVRDITSSQKAFDETLRLIDAAPNIKPKIKDRIKFLRELHELVILNPTLGQGSENPEEDYSHIIQKLVDISWNKKYEQATSLNAPSHVKKSLDRSKGLIIDLLHKVILDATSGKSFDFLHIAECFNPENFRSETLCSYLSIFSRIRISAASLCQEVQAKAINTWTEGNTAIEQTLKNLMRELNANTIVNTLTEALKEPACQQAIMLMVAQYAQPAVAGNHLPVANSTLSIEIPNELDQGSFSYKR